VEKGSVTTALDHGLVVPKSLGNSLKALFWLASCSPSSKGNQVNIPELCPGSSGNATEPCDGDTTLRESSLFSLTIKVPWNMPSMR